MILGADDNLSRPRTPIGNPLRAGRTAAVQASSAAALIAAAAQKQRDDLASRGTVIPRPRRGPRFGAGLPPPPPPPPSSSGPPTKKIPWKKIAIGAGVLGVVIFLATRKSSSKGSSSSSSEPRETHANPDDDDEEAAVRFYKKFHWGRSPRKRSRVRVSDVPRQLVKLGTLEAVTYSARKGAEALADYIHHFGEGGTAKPTLAAEPRTRRLHIIGGGYDVKEAGIVG